MRFYYAALLATAIALFAGAGFPSAALRAQPSDAAPIIGTLVNGTDAGAIPAGATVFLHIFGADSGAVDTYETVTDAGGAFRFDAAPPMPDAGSAAIVASYGGARYSTSLAPAQLSAPLTLTVYEATQDVGVVATAEQSIIIAGIDRATQRIAAVQLFTLENRSDTTLVPDLSAPPVIGQFSFLRFSLPPNAEDLDVSTDLAGGEVIPVGTGFALTAPAPPGRHQVQFTYTVPYETGALAWRDNTLQGAETLRLLIPAEFGAIAVSGLRPAETFSVGEISYRVWQEEGIAPGAGVNLALSGLPEPSWLTRLGNPLAELRFWYGALPALVAVALAGLLAWGIVRRPAQRAAGRSA